MSLTKRSAAEFMGTFWLVRQCCPDRRFSEGWDRLAGCVVCVRPDRPDHGLCHRAHLGLPLEPAVSRDESVSEPRAEQGAGRLRGRLGAGPTVALLAGAYCGGGGGGGRLSVAGQDLERLTIGCPH
jgi:hypothetical protein